MVINYEGVGIEHQNVVINSDVIFYLKIPKVEEVNIESVEKNNAVEDLSLVKDFVAFVQAVIYENVVSKVKHILMVRTVLFNDINKVLKDDGFQKIVTVKKDGRTGMVNSHVNNVTVLQEDLDDDDVLFNVSICKENPARIFHTVEVLGDVFNVLDFMVLKNYQNVQKKLPLKRVEVDTVTFNVRKVKDKALVKDIVQGKGMAFNVINYSSGSKETVVKGRTVVSDVSEGKDDLD